MTSKFLKPKDEITWKEDKSDVEPHSFTSFVYNNNISCAIDEQREKLPILKNKSHIIYLLEKYQTLVLVGETGCGKSTQVPQYLYEVGWCVDGKVIGITEPRRVAATTLANRVAEEKKSELGDLVGYAIRFDDCTSDNTKIKYTTEGLLMREMMSDPLLRQYCVIMIDEVHERSLNTDILLGLMKKILKKRKGLRLIVTSATADAEHFRDFFNFNKTTDEATSTILSVQGRLHPVDTMFLFEPVADYVQAVADTILKIHQYDVNGDILAFLTGQDEVDKVVNLLSNNETVSKYNTVMLPLRLYGSLTDYEQRKAFRYAPKGFRKVVVATNIAETSVTVPGIVFVVDCGFVKMKWFDVESYTESLIVVPISKSSAIQRAGRAGRVKPGKVYRLYSEESFNKFDSETPCEMNRVELSPAVLQLKALGIDNVVRFSFPSPPPARSLLAAMELLHALGAINENADLSRPLGLQMAEFPLSPLHAKSLLISHLFGCSDEMSCILSLLQIQNIFCSPTSGQMSIKARVAQRHFEVEEGDLLTMLNVFKAFLYRSEANRRGWCQKYFINYKAMKRAEKLHHQILTILNKFNIPIINSNKDKESVCKCIAAGFFPNAAYLHGSGVYKTIRGNKDLHIHPSSVFYTLQQPQWVIFCETIHSDKLYMRELTVIEPNWLHELAPHFYHKTSSIL